MALAVLPALGVCGGRHATNDNNYDRMTTVVDANSTHVALAEQTASLAEQTTTDDDDSGGQEEEDQAILDWLVSSSPPPASNVTTTKPLTVNVADGTTTTTSTSNNETTRLTPFQQPMVCKFGRVTVFNGYCR